MTQQEKKNTAAKIKLPLPSPDDVPYLNLSTLVKEHLLMPQRSDTFTKNLKDAIREGEVRGAQLNTRFTLPKRFRKRGSDEDYTRDTRDFMVANTEEFHEWFNEMNNSLSASKEGKIKITEDAITSGLLDFDTLFEETQRKLQKNYEKGQALGLQRASDKAAAVDEDDSDEEEAPAPKPTAKKKVAAAPAKPAAKPAPKTKPAPEPVDEDDDDSDDDDAGDDDLLDDE